MQSARLWLSGLVHPVYLVCGLCAGVLIGAFVARFFLFEWLVSPWWLGVYMIVMIGLFWRRPRWAVGAMVGVGMLCGYTRGANEMVQLLAVQPLHGQDLMLEGRVSEDGATSAGGSMAFRLREVTLSGTRVAGEYWVTVADPSAKEIKRSDHVTVRGRLEEGFGSLAGTMYRAQVLSIEREGLRDPFVRLRDWFSAGIYRVLPPVEASLGAGYVLGQKQALPPDFEEALRVVGLTHVVVASGYNLTILVRIARRIFARISRYLAAVAGGAMTLIFIGITGLSPSMTRAGLVAGISLLVWYYGRNIHPMVLLLVVAALTVFAKPAYIWGDVGWLLSFASFIGVMLLAPLLQAYFFDVSEPPGTIRQIIGETLSAQLMTTPIIIVLFGTVSNVALVANLLILPFVPLAMLLVFVSGLMALWLPWAAVFIAVPTSWLLQYMTHTVALLAELSWASFEVSFGIEFALACYAILFLVMIGLRRKAHVEYRSINVIK